MTTSKGKRVFDMQLVKGCKPDDMVRLLHDQPFSGSNPIDRFTHARVLALKDAAAIINEDIKSGNGVSPLTKYVDAI